MGKYLRHFESIAAATGAQDLLAPNVTLMQVGGNDKILMKNGTGVEELQISGSSLADLEIKEKPVAPTHEYVDLGIRIDNKPILFAKYNVGVDPTKLTTAEDWYGDYVAWGETEPYYSGSAAQPTFPTGSGGYNFTPDGEYPYVNSYGEEVTGVTQPYNSSTLTLNTDNDAVTAAWGDAWRMPTNAELRELTGLTSEWVTNYHDVNGLNGRVFSGVTGSECAGNTLFVPAAGYFDGTSRSNAGGYCYVWSSTRYRSMATHARYMYFLASRASTDIDIRYRGCSLRGVYISQ